MRRGRAGRSLHFRRSRDRRGRGRGAGGDGSRRRGRARRVDSSGCRRGNARCHCGSRRRSPWGRGRGRRGGACSRCGHIERLGGAPTNTAARSCRGGHAHFRRWGCKRRLFRGYRRSVGKSGAFDGRWLRGSGPAANDGRRVRGRGSNGRVGRRRRATTAPRRRRRLLNSCALFAFPARAHACDLFVGEWAEMGANRHIHRAEEAHDLIGRYAELACHVVHSKLTHTAS